MLREQLSIAAIPVPVHVLGVPVMLCTPNKLRLSTQSKDSSNPCCKMYSTCSQNPTTEACDPIGLRNILSDKSILFYCCQVLCGDAHTLNEHSQGQQLRAIFVPHQSPTIEEVQVARHSQRGQLSSVNRQFWVNSVCNVQVKRLSGGKNGSDSIS